MDKIYEQEYHLLEENYWWFEARRHFILKLVKKLKLERNSKILEIGCSGGPLIRELNNLGFNNVYGIDISPEAISLCTKRGLSNVQIMDATETNFKDGEFDLIISSDILEHIKDEDKALDEWERILAPSGHLIVFVPAFDFLWSYHDDVNLHYRRYTRKKLVSSIEPLKLKIIKNSYWNFTLFFPAFIIRFLLKSNKKPQSGDLINVNWFVNYLLKKLIKLENHFLLYFKFPFGISTFVHCKKE